MTCGEPEALLYARGPHWRRRCVCKERLRAALRWCSSRPRLARMSITASRRTHSSTVQNRSGTPFRYAAVHENLTGSQESRVARAYVHILRIYQRLYKNREKLDHSMRAFLCAIAHSNVGWRSPVISSLAACVSVTLCGVPVQRGADPWPTFRAIPPPSRPFASQPHPPPPAPPPRPDSCASPPARARRRCSTTRLRASIL